MDHIRRVIMGLGSNVGDRVRNLNDAINEFRRDRDMHVLSVSTFYETEAELTAAQTAAQTGQPDFVNGAVLVLTSLPATEILKRALAIEEKYGRVRSAEATPKGPRTLDIDVLWIEGELIDEPGLTVPHPRLASRAFALRPLVDLASDARDGAGDAYADNPLSKTELRLAPR